MLMETIQGIIYVITNSVNNKMYVGQTRNLKTMRGYTYEYGINQRFMEHVGAARRNKSTPIAEAIAEYGPEKFYIDEIERCDLNIINEREAFYIQEFGTIVPNGYNVQKQSGHVIKDNCEKITLKGIKQNGQLDYVRAYIKYPDGNERTNFYGNTYAEALDKARTYFVRLGFGPETVIEHESLFEIPVERPSWWPYKDKIDKFNGRTVTRIRVCGFGSQNLVRVQVKTADMQSWRDEEKERIVFGSKKIPLNETIIIAMSVVEKLEQIHGVKHIMDSKLEPYYQRRQQVAAN